MTLRTWLPDAFHYLVSYDNFHCQTPNSTHLNIILKWLDEAGIMATACARKFSLRLRLYVSSPHHAFSGNSTQLLWHDCVHLSSVYTDYSFSS